MAYKNLQLRRDTAANWASNNPTLLVGEMGMETNTLKVKAGDGSTAWNSLVYLAVGGLADGLSASQTVMTDANKLLVSVDYLDQSVKSTASPAFAGATLTGVVDHDVTLTTTGTTGLDLLTQFDHSENITIGHCGKFSAENISDSQITGSLNGIECKALQNGDGLITTARGLICTIENISTGDITNAYTLHVTVPNITNTGTIGTAYGLRVEAQKQTGVAIGYGIYQVGTNDLNYFAGVTEFKKTVYFDTEIDNDNSGAADTIDWTAGNKQKSTLTDNCTFTFTEPSGPCNLVLKLIQDGTGDRTVVWPGDIKWPGGTAPTLSTGIAAIDIVCFYYDGADFYGNCSLNFSVPV